MPPSAVGTARRRSFNRNVLQFIVDHCVPYSSTWVWEFSSQMETFSITPQRDAVYINFTRQVNQQLVSKCP